MKRSAEHFVAAFGPRFTLWVRRRGYGGYKAPGGGELRLQSPHPQSKTRAKSSHEGSAERFIDLLLVS